MPIPDPNDTIKISEALKYASQKTLWTYVKRRRISLYKDYRGRNVYLRSELEEVFGTLKLFSEKADPVKMATEILRRCADKLRE